MKKLVLTLAIVFAGIMSVNAQGWWIGGGIGADIHKNHTGFNINPEIGYVINNHWQVALGAGYGFTREVTPALLPGTRAPGVRALPPLPAAALAAAHSRHQSMLVSATAGKNGWVSSKAFVISRESRRNRLSRRLTTIGA